METKDIIQGIGIILTFIVSSTALIISIKNRSNVIREHLYKEQFRCFLELSREYAILGLQLENLIIDNNWSDAVDEQIEKQLHNINLLIDTYDFLLPDDILTAMNTLEKCFDDLHLLAINTGKITNEQAKELWTAHYTLLDEIRAFIGVDELSEENKKLYKKNK